MLPVLQGAAATGPDPLVLHVGTSASAAPLHVRTFAETAREHFEAREHFGADHVGADFQSLYTAC